MAERCISFFTPLHGRDDHRPDESLPLEEQFGPAHDIEILPGGVLATLTAMRHATVNTAHMQGIDKVAPDARVEALSPDGTVEAISVDSAKAFAVGVQFHPEWDTQKNPLYVALFAGFRKAVEDRAARRVGSYGAGTLSGG